ncbi:DUF2634 domain-containing protein [Lysinibacillus sp. 3P01SB]|uniref:DUF2634 domain-containing protein n=1 Tax=Lysinibacillus sp. 3P01SB TaxID=3132284 RepID=UPI0039A53447
MFPENVQEYLEEEEVILMDTAPTYNGKAFLYDFKKGDFILENGKLVQVEGLEALKIWIEKLLRTEKFRFKIYEDVEYCVTIEDLIGGVWPPGFVEAELRREITEAAITNPYIEDLIEWKFERDSSYLHIYFTVLTPEGAFEMGVDF